MISHDVVEDCNDLHFFDAFDTSEEEEEDQNDRVLRGKSKEDGGSTNYQRELQRYPNGAELGLHGNCWSEPPARDWNVRGITYLFDHTKVPSDDAYIFPMRGVDIFRTDKHFTNVGRNARLLGGRLRDVPTFIVNFHVSFGVFICYYEIPDRFLPFLATTEKNVNNNTRNNGNKGTNTEKLLDKMTPVDRTVCRFLMGDDSYRKDKLKIIPSLAKGPWGVEKVVGNKPCIIGTYLPVTYVYQPATLDSRSAKSMAPYLEVDIDIVKSWSAQGICSVVMKACREVTIDLGFVIEGKEQDELPEQMLTGTRLHQFDDPSTNALPFPANSSLPSSSAVRQPKQYYNDISTENRNKKDDVEPDLFFEAEA